MPKRRRSRAEREAEDLLAQNGVSEPSVDVEALARAQGAEVRFVQADPKLSGMLAREDGRIVIGVNASHHRNRQRFTIAHELGHLVLHLRGRQQPLFVDERMVYFRDEVSSRAVDQEEIQANTFAAALLMPRSFLLADLRGRDLDINDDIEVSRLGRRYEVSVQALSIRLSWLGLVDGLPPVRR